jgi:hypothetical protein
MTLPDLALTLAFILACVGFWAALVAIALYDELAQWERMDDDE